MNRKVFIDLENTVIDDWENMNFLTDEANFVLKNLRRTDEISLFSFAIWNQQDVDRFDLLLRKPLEAFFEKPITSIPTMQEIRQTVLKFRGLTIDLVDFTSIFPKHLAFIEYIRATETKGEFVLFDDSVENWSIEVNDKKILIIKV